MKKMVLLFAIVVATLSINAQVINVTADSINYRKYEDRYLFNHCSREGINLDIIEWRIGSSNGIPCGGYHLPSGTEVYDIAAISTNPSNRQVDFAQPYEVSVPITIDGVSGFVWHYAPEQYQDSCKWYFEIWDSTLTTVLRSVDITDTTTPHTYYEYYIDGHRAIGYNCTYYKYTEKFFDEPLTITGKFYVVYHTPDSVFHPTGLTTMTSYIMGNTICTPGTELYPLKRGGTNADGGDESNEWRHFLSYYSLYQQADTVTALYLFPILADSNFSGLEENSTLEAVRVFPNPADNEVNINSGYKIERIFLYDESGKLLQENEVKAYNYKIDLQHYPQGSYLLKVQTTKNQSTHKIIKQ